MFGHRRTADVEVRRDLSRRALLTPDQPQDLLAPRICYRLQQLLHACKCSRSVTKCIGYALKTSKTALIPAQVRAESQCAPAMRGKRPT